jgi:hypothetical protein
MSLLAPRTVLAQPATANAQTRIVTKDAMRETFMAMAPVGLAHMKRWCPKIGSGQSPAAKSKAIAGRQRASGYLLLGMPAFIRNP